MHSLALLFLYRVTNLRSAVVRKMKESSIFQSNREFGKLKADKDIKKNLLINGRTLLLLDCVALLLLNSVTNLFKIGMKYHFASEDFYFYTCSFTVS